MFFLCARFVIFSENESLEQSMIYMSYLKIIMIV